jgi:hypothetical protein
MCHMSRPAWVFLGLWLLGLTPALAQEKPPETIRLQRRMRGAGSTKSFFDCGGQVTP